MGHRAGGGQLRERVHGHPRRVAAGAGTTPFELNPDFADTPAASDPLGASVEGFLQAVRGLAPRPVVTAEEAIAALDLAIAVEQALEDAA